MPAGRREGRGPADAMAGIIKKQILKHLSRSVRRRAPGGLRRAAAAAPPVPASPGGERPPGPGAGRGDRASFSPPRVEPEPPPRGDSWGRPVACAGLSGADSRIHGP